jgi:hypothetical protein
MRTTRHSILGAGKTPDWAGATPPFGAFSRPKTSWGRSSPHVREQGTILQSNMKCMSQPRVHICNSEAVRV